MANRVLGVDLGSSSIKIAQVLRNDNGTFVVEKQAAQAVPRNAIVDGKIAEAERARVSGILAQMVEQGGFDTRDAIYGLNSSASVFMERILAPVGDEETLEKSLKYLIPAAFRGINIDDNEISWSIAGEVQTDSGPQTEVLVYRCFKSYTAELADVVEKAGLTVVGADLNPLAALRAMSIQHRPEGQVDAIVDVGANVVTMMLHHNGVPVSLTLDPNNAGDVATQNILYAMPDLDDDQMDLAEYHKINDDSSHGPIAQARNKYSRSLASRVEGVFQNAVAANDRIHSIVNVTLVGGGALIGSIGYFLREALGEGLPITYANHFDPRITGINGEPIRQTATGGDYLVAIGLGTAETY